MQHHEEVMFVDLPEEVVVRVCAFLDPPALIALGSVGEEYKRIVLEQAFKRGFKWARWRFLDRALDFLSACIALDPEHRPSFDERAIARFNMGDRAGALEDLRRSIELSQDRVSRLVFEAISFEMTGQLQKSLACAREAMELEPLNPRPYFEVAYVLQELPFQADFVGSAEAYTKALQYGYHREYVATFNRGWSREESGNVAEALVDYEKTISLNPFFQQAARSVARLRVRAGDVAAVHEDIMQCQQRIASAREIGETPALYAHLFVQMAYDHDALGADREALQCYTDAIEHDFPRPATLYNARGYVHERMLNHHLAIQDYTRATECDALFTMGLENRARLLARAGQRDAARADWEMVKLRDPLSSHAYHCVCRFLQDAGDTAGAIEQLQLALKANPLAENIQTRFMLAEAFSVAGQFSSAHDCYLAVLNVYPKAALPLKLQAHVCLRLGMICEADVLLARVLEIDGSDSVCVNNAGCVRFCRRRYAEAVEIWSRRLSSDDVGDFKCRINRAHALMKLKRYDEAVQDYQLLSERFPGTATAQLLLQAREQPEALARLLGCGRLLWRMQYSFETWMSNPSPYIVASQEYRFSDSEDDDDARADEDGGGGEGRGGDGDDDDDSFSL